LLACTSVEVERVPIGRVIDAVPAVKDEGDLLVVPVVEETVVVERRLVLKEELHIRRVHTTERYRDTLKLRYQTAEVTRIPAQKPTTDGEPVAGPARPNPEDT
jgi:stress response protein YsnF